MSSGNGARRGLSAGIVGAGFGGIGAAIRLREAGFEELTVFERGETVGGVWRANTYPGAACDVPSHLYSFSFAPGHHWSRRYAPQPEILTYLEDSAPATSAITPHLRLGTEVTEARFDAERGRWTRGHRLGRACTSSTSWSPPAASSPGPRSRRCPGSATSRGPCSTPPNGTTTST